MGLNYDEDFMIPGPTHKRPAPLVYKGSDIDMNEVAREFSKIMKDIDKEPFITKKMTGFTKINKEPGNIAANVIKATTTFADLERLGILYMLPVGMITENQTKIGKWLLTDEGQGWFSKALNEAENIKMGHLIDDTKTETEEAESEQEPIQSQFMSELTDAAYRVASTQLSTAIKKAMLNSIPLDKSSGLMSFLNSEYGNGFVSMLAGYMLTYAWKDNTKAQKLATEFRVNGMTTLGNNVIEGLLGSIGDIAFNALSSIPNAPSSIPNEEKQIRVSSSHEEERLPTQKESQHEIPQISESDLFHPEEEEDQSIDIEFEVEKDFSIN